MQNLKNSDQIICMDAGGSKTVVEILDSKGKLLKSVLADGINLASMPAQQITATLHSLFKQIHITDHSSLICGCAGAERDENKRLLSTFFNSLGLSTQKTVITSDASLALQLIENQGAILIAGTGSVCMGKHGNKTLRAGGLGRYLGDEGSGYATGLLALKAAIADEQNWGEATLLRASIAKQLNSSNLTKLITPLNSGKIDASTIASLAPLVFEKASNNDLLSQNILKKSALELGKLLLSVTNRLELYNPPVYLLGGLFTSNYAEPFISQISNSIATQNRPYFTNIAKYKIATLVARELLLRSKPPLFSHISSLPIAPLSNAESSTIDGENISTEQQNKITANLSKAFAKDRLKGLQLLTKANSVITAQLAHFIKTDLPQLYQNLRSTFSRNGRLFLVGCGSSGRVAYLLAKKWNNNNAGEVIPIIAGGITALIRPKEGTEDSKAAGSKAIEPYALSANDCVILISASGVAAFNLKIGEIAIKAGASCFLFSNNTDLQLSNIPAIIVDIGAQSITGSTRLQAADSAIFCLGTLLSSFYENFNAEKLLEEYQQSLKNTESKLPQIKKIIDLEIEIFGSENANFFREKDETNCGYITWLAGEESLFETVIDTAETSPTFSTNPPRLINEIEKKKAEFRAYLQNEPNNCKAWQTLIGRELTLDEESEIETLLLAQHTVGFGSYAKRPTGKGNLLCGITLKDSPRLNLSLQRAKQTGCKTALIEINPACSLNDPLSLIHSLSLKHLFNLLSNGAMLGMKKVHGNSMIDLSPSNNKLQDRAARILSDLYKNEESIPSEIDPLILKEVVKRAYWMKKCTEAQLHKQLPSPIKLASTMLTQQCSSEQAIELLKALQKALR